MSIFLLVHGGFYGGWGWAKVARQLRAAGHDVLTPTLTGFGERSHLLTRDTGLHTHVQDVISVLQCEDLKQVILVGHSYGSIVNAGVLEKEHKRIAQFVCVDGFIPKEGQNNFDLIGPEMTRQWSEYATEEGDGWLCPPLPNPPYTPPRWQRMTLKMCTDRLDIKNPAAIKVPHAFIHCTERDKDEPMATGFALIDSAAEEAKRLGWCYRAVAADHGIVFNNPKLLADTLLELAQAPDRSPDG